MITNNRNSCGYDPCQCHTSCNTPVACIPAPLAHRPSSPTVSVEGLLKLIDAKCDEEICGFIQGEITLLFMLLGLEGHRPPPPATFNFIPALPTTPVAGVVTPAAQFNFSATSPGVPVKVIQLISNMVETLNGDLTNKYASAELLKKEIKTIWECLYNKQQHHGDWDTNFIIRDLLHSEDDHCLFDGDPNSIPNTIKVVVPVDVGSTVFHTVNGERQLFGSLVDNNITEPSQASVDAGKWINYSDTTKIADAMNLATAAHTFRDVVIGRVDIVHDGINGITTKDAISTREDYTFDEDTFTLDVNKYKYLAVAGRKIKVTGTATVGYHLDTTDKTLSTMDYQWGTAIHVAGSLEKHPGHLYTYNKSGGNSALTDTFSFDLVTTGNSLVITFAHMFRVYTLKGTTPTTATIGDTLTVDTASCTLAFNAEV